MADADKDDSLRRTRSLHDSRFSPLPTTPQRRGTVHETLSRSRVFVPLVPLRRAAAPSPPQKDLHYGSITDAEARELEPEPESMSLAAVESIQKLPTFSGYGVGKNKMMAGGTSSSTSSVRARLIATSEKGLQPLAKVLGKPEDEEWRRVMLLMTVLGVLSAMLTFAMDVAIEKIGTLRADHYDDFASHRALGSLVWIGYGLLWGVLAIWITAKISPLAAGSGIPEIKSILAGNILYKYLSKRTLCAKVLGLTCALGSGLPLGKEGPFIHTSCCLCEWLFTQPLFRSLKVSHAIRTQMLLAACSVGVGANFGAPIGGVLLAIEMTSTYFLVLIYWKCFFTATVGAVLSRILYMAYKEKTHFLEARFQSFMQAEDVEADLVQLPAFVVLGLVCGLLGAAWVRLHAKFSAFRGRHANSAFFRSKYAFGLVVLLLWGIVSMPDGPVGSFMSKPQLKAMAELFGSHVMSAEWGRSERELVLNLLLFFGLRCAFCLVAITLPVPCGVFAPSLCVGAALGRLCGEGMKYMLPEHDTSPGGYAVLGAAGMCAAVTHTISSAVLMLELTDGSKHVLPMIVTTVTAYVTAHTLSLSIFDSILRMKKLPYLPEFSRRDSYHRSVREVLSHLIERQQDKRVMAHVFCIMRGERHTAFSRWRAVSERAKRKRSKKPHLVHPSQGAVPVVAKPRGGGGTTNAVFRSSSIAEMEHLLSRCTWAFFPWIEEASHVLLGAIRRSALRKLVEARKRKFALNESAVLSQRFASRRACNSLHNTLASSASSSSLARSAGDPEEAGPAGGGSSSTRDSWQASRADAPRPLLARATGGSSELLPDEAPPAKPPKPSAPFLGSLRDGWQRVRALGSRAMLSPQPGAAPLDKTALASMPRVPVVSIAEADEEDDDSPTRDEELSLETEAEDRQSMFAGGQSAPPAMLAHIERPAPSQPAEEKVPSSMSAPSLLAPPTAHGAHAGGANLGSARYAQMSKSVEFLSEHAGQAELDTSEWLTINTPDGLQLTCTLADYLDVALSDEEWNGLQVEEAPFCIAASASMGQVHFYFSMLSLSCAFVTNHGKYVGLITKADLAESGL